MTLGIDSGSGAGMTGRGPFDFPLRRAQDRLRGNETAQAQAMAMVFVRGDDGGMGRSEGMVVGCGGGERCFAPTMVGAAGLGALGARFRRPLRNPGSPCALRFPSGRTDNPGPGYGMVFVRGDEGGMGRSGGMVDGCGEGERFFAPTRLDARRGWFKVAPSM